MRKITVILAILTAVVMLSSCKKESSVNPNDVGKTFVRIAEVDKDNTIQNSVIVATYVKYLFALWFGLSRSSLSWWPTIYFKEKYIAMKDDQKSPSDLMWILTSEDLFLDLE